MNRYIRSMIVSVFAAWILLGSGTTSVGAAAAGTGQTISRVVAGVSQVIAPATDRGQKGLPAAADRSKTIAPAALSITTQPPAEKTVDAGTKFTLSVKASGTGLTYQWQYKKPGGSSWVSSTVSSAKTTNFTLTANASWDGRLYRCRIKDGNGKTVYSKSVTLHVTVPLTITTQPTGKTVDAGAKVTFSVKASGVGLTYQWQYKKPGGSSWVSSTSSSAKKATFTSTANASWDGRLYRCRIKDANGKTVYSKSVTLHVNKPLEITCQPESITVDKGQKFTMRITATGEGLTYQWQYKSAGGSTWTSSTAASAKTASFTSTASASWNGRQYRCKVTDKSGKTLTSISAILNVRTSLRIVSSPASETVSPNEEFTMHVIAEGQGLQYRWQYSTDGGKTWTSTSVVSADTDSFRAKALASWDGRMFRCRVTDADGAQVYSEPATLTIDPTMHFYADPADTMVRVGQKFSFEVEVVGLNLSFQWSYSEDGGKTWVDIETQSAKTKRLTGTCYYTYFGRLYRCTITDYKGVKTVTRPALLMSEIDTPAIGELYNNGNGVMIRWVSHPDVPKYCVLRMLADGSSWVKLGYTTENEYLDTSARLGNDYLYKIYGCDQDGNYITPVGGPAQISYRLEINAQRFTTSIAAYLYSSPDFTSTSRVVPYQTALFVNEIVKETLNGFWYEVMLGDDTYYLYVTKGAPVLAETATSRTYIANNALAQEAINEALTWLDKKTVYKRGDSTGIPDGNGNYYFDCSGFVTYVLESVMKKQVPTYQYYTKVSEMLTLDSIYNKGYANEFKPVDATLDSMEPGDLIFFALTGEAEIGEENDSVATHVGMYLGNNEFIHCSHYDWGGSGVYLMPLTGYYLESVVAVRRFMPEKVLPAMQNLYAASNNVRVRKNPDVTEEAIAQIPLGNSVVLYYTNNNGWAYCEYEEGKFGYILLSALTDEP